VGFGENKHAVIKYGCCSLARRRRRAAAAVAKLLSDVMK